MSLRQLLGSGRLDQKLRGATYVDTGIPLSLADDVEEVTEVDPHFPMAEAARAAFRTLCVYLAAAVFVDQKGVEETLEALRERCLILSSPEDEFLLGPLAIEIEKTIAQHGAMVVATKWSTNSLYVAAALSVALSYVRFPGGRK